LGISLGGQPVKHRHKLPCKHCLVTRCKDSSALVPVKSSYSIRNNITKAIKFQIYVVLTVLRAYQILMLIQYKSTTEKHHSPSILRNEVDSKRIVSRDSIL
jgi:hypothetical protein